MSPRRPIELQRKIALDEDYWLGHCEGFRVEAEGRRLGVVAAVRFRSRLECPDELVVCAGLFGKRVLLVPGGEVAAVIPRDELLVLSTQPQAPRPPREPAFLQRLVAAAQNLAHALHA